jgi:hypothetical protein
MSMKETARMSVGFEAEKDEIKRRYRRLFPSKRVHELLLVRPRGGLGLIGVVHPFGW